MPSTMYKYSCGTAPTRHLARIGGGEPDLLARLPFVGGVTADVDHRIGGELVLEPEVEREVLVVQRQLEVVVGGGDVLLPAAGGLRCEEHVAPAVDGEDEERPTLVVAPDHRAGGLGLAPLGDDGVAQLDGQAVEMLPVRRDGPEDGMAAAHEAVEIGGIVGAGVGAVVAHGGEERLGRVGRAGGGVAVGTEAAENLPEGAGEDVEVGGADVFAAGRVVVVNDGDAALGRGGVTEAHEAGDAIGEALDALGDGHLDDIGGTGEAGCDALLGGDDGGCDGAGEFGAADLPGAFENSDAGGRCFPFGAALGTETDAVRTGAPSAASAGTTISGAKPILRENEANASTRGEPSAARNARRRARSCEGV
jgi:hypothetical protein